jgi:hypothetical protein
MRDEEPLKHVEIGAKEILEAALRVVMNRGDGDAVTSFDITVDLLSNMVTGPEQMPSDVAARAFQDVDELVTRTIELAMVDPAVGSLLRAAGLAEEDIPDDERFVSDAHLMAALALLKFGAHAANHLPFWDEER